MVSKEFMVIDAKNDLALQDLYAEIFRNVLKGLMVLADHLSVIQWTAPNADSMLLKKIVDKYRQKLQILISR